MESHASVLSAPYGQACTNCAQSKCKCIIRRAGGPCERCHRTNKECRPATTVRRRNPRKPAVSKTASARLEEKLDGLVSLIKAGKQSDSIAASPQLLSTTENSPTPTPATTDSTNFPYSLPPFTLRDIDEPSSVEAEQSLMNFQTNKSKYLPFVHIPSTTNSSQLRQERPFLWLSIMTVGAKSISRQQVLVGKMRETIAQEMVIQSEMNIDLLLGLLTFIGWPHYQAHNKPFLTMFTQLVMSLVWDLGLNRPIPKDANYVFSICPKRSLTSPRTMEERRAVLGCFLVTSVISLVLQKIDALRWTPHMDECLRILDESKDCPNDEILVQQVRLQRIVQKLALSSSYSGAMEWTEEPAPVSLSLENLNSQLQSVKASILSGPPTDEVVRLHLYSTELEIAFSSPFHQIDQLTIKQRKWLDAGLNSVTSWFGVFFTITPAAYINLPFPVFWQMIRCLITLYRLTTLKDQTWDVCKTADPLIIANRIINNLEQVAILNGLDSSESTTGDVFSRAAQMVKSFRAEWEARLGPEDLVLPTVQTPQNINEISFPGVPEGESFGDDWFMDLILFPDY